VTGAELGARLREGDLSAAPAVLNLVENRRARDDVAALLHETSPAALGGEAGAHVVGITGPPGAGKSTLLGELVRARRRTSSAPRTIAWTCPR
jgi:LAO/AO transport system kinase